MSSAAIRMSYGVDSVLGPKSRQGPLPGLTIPEKAVRSAPSLAVSDAFRLWYAGHPSILFRT